MLLIITFLIGNYKWINGIGLKEPYQSQLVGNYKKINTFLSSLKDHKEKPTLLKTARRLDNWGFILVIICGLFNMFFGGFYFILYLSIMAVSMIMLGFSINWVLIHKKTVKSYLFNFLGIVLFPFILIGLDHITETDILTPFYQLFIDKFPYAFVKNKWIVATITSLGLMTGIISLYIFAWGFAIPITYGTYSMLWIFNKYLKITNKVTDNLISAVLYALWVITFIWGIYEN